MATIRIPTPLRRFTRGAEQVAVSAATVRAALDQLEADSPGIGARIRDESGNVRRFVNIFVADEDIRHLAGLDTELAEGDELSIIPAIAGG